jgi:hypothetical protein
MAIQGPYIFSAAMDVQPDKEQLFHEVYDTEHVPMLLEVPGVISVARFVLQPEMTIMLGGQRKRVVVDGGEPKFHALYEIASPDVLTTEAWAAAVDRGRWPDQVRPFTRNRQHRMYRRVGG